MKKYKGFNSTLSVLVLAMLAVSMVVSPAYAGNTIWADSEYGGTSTNGAGLPAIADEKTVVYSIHAVGNASAVNLVFYGWADESAYLLNTEVSGSVALTINECGTIADNTIVFIQKKGDPNVFDVVNASACNDTTNVMTVAAIDSQFNTGSAVYEMSAQNTYPNWGSSAAGRTMESDRGVFMGRKTGTPVGVVFSGAGGKINWLSGGSVKP